MAVVPAQDTSKHEYKENEIRDECREDKGTSTRTTIEHANTIILVPAKCDYA